METTTEKMIYLTSRDLILMRDEMSDAELKKQTQETLKRDGIVTYRGIFKTMGYEHAFNNTYKKVK